MPLLLAAGMEVEDGLLSEEGQQILMVRGGGPRLVGEVNLMCSVGPGLGLMLN